jgi:membrane protein involved in colicin uptake
VVNGKGAEVYTMGGAPRKKAANTEKKAEIANKKPENATPAAAEPAPAEKAPDDLMYRCEMCGKVLQPYKGPSGRMVGLMQHANASKKKFGHVLCLACIENWPLKENGGQE